MTDYQPSEREALAEDFDPPSLLPRFAALVRDVRGEWCVEAPSELDAIIAQRFIDALIDAAKEHGHQRLHEPEGWQDEIVRLFPWLVDWDEPTRICPSLMGMRAEDALTVLLDKGETKPANWLRHVMGYRLPRGGAVAESLPPSPSEGPWEVRQNREGAYEIVPKVGSTVPGGICCWVLYDRNLPFARELCDWMNGNPLAQMSSSPSETEK